MKLHRDASNRLTASLDAEASSYRALVERVVRRFRLAPVGPLVDGGDVVFQDFGNGEARVALEWDNWMGFQVVARSVESEPLVAAIAAFLGGGTDERPSRWRPLSREQIENELAAAVSSLHATHAARFAKLRVPLRLAPVTAHPGESVWVVAEHEGQMLYYSDVEGGWAIARANAAGGIADRDGSQLELSHVMTQLFGDPEQGSR